MGQACSGTPRRAWALLTPELAATTSAVALCGGSVSGWLLGKPELQRQRAALTGSVPGAASVPC